MRIKVTTKLLTTGNRLMSLTQQLCKVPSQDWFLSAYQTLEVDPIVKFSEVMRRGKRRSQGQQVSTLSKVKELEGTGDREMVLASGAKSTQKSLQTSSRTHSSIEIDRQKFYKSETQRRDKRQHKGAKPDRQLLGQEVQISPDIARLFQTIDRLNLSGTIKSQKEEEKITSFQSHRHQPRLDNVSSSNSKSTQQSSQNSSQDTSSVDINPQTPTLSLNTLNPTGGQKRQETKENVQLNNPPLVQVSPTTSPQGMRLRQSSAGIAGILQANLKTPDLSQEFTQANYEEKQEQTEQSQSNDSASSLTSSSPLVPMSKESAMEQIITKLTEKLEFEYLRTYGNFPGEQI